MESAEEESEDVPLTNVLVYHHEDDDDNDISDAETSKLLSNVVASSNDNDNNNNNNNNGVPRVEEDPVVVYKTRWLMLFIFSLNTAMNGCLFMSLSPINDIVRKYYDVQSVGIEWLSNMCVVAYILLSLPATYLITKYGIRPIIITAATCNFLATLLHFAGYQQDRFYLVVVGQVFAAVAYSTILQMPGKLSSLWFPDAERATATSIGVVMNLFGVAIGFMQPSMMVRADRALESEMKMFYLSQLLTAAIVLLVTFFYRELPPTPPSSQSSRSPLSFGESLSLLMRNKYFIFLSQSYAIYFALFVAIFVLINPLVTAVYRHGYELSIGWMGFCNNMVAMVAFLTIGRLLDRYHRYRLTAVLLNTTSMLLWLVFVVLLTSSTTSFTSLYVVYVLLGLVFVPFFSSGIEQAAEMTYPVSEVTSSSVMLLLGNAYAFVFIILFGVLAQNHYLEVVGYCMVGLYAVSAVCACMAKTDLHRKVSEKSVG